MGAALALAVMLVVVVAIMSLAVNAQGPFQATGQGAQRAGPARAPAPSPSASERRRQAPPEQPRRPPRDKAERSRERRGAPPVEVPADPAPAADPLVPLADLRPLDTEATATVISVVDERTLGPVTRSRLSLRVHPPSGEEFEVTTRVAFPTPEARAKVKVGSTIAVRYDQDDRRRVVVDMERDG